MTDRNADVPLDWTLGYQAGLDHGRADARDGKPPTTDQPPAGLWWDAYHQGYNAGRAQLFAVIEYSSFYAVRHLPTGAEVPMGDGVDALFFKDEEHEEGQPRMPGTAGFVQEWTDALNANALETLEAYFPELHSQQAWGAWAEGAGDDPQVQNMLKQRPQDAPCWFPGPNDLPLWMDAVNASPTAMLSACKTFLACPPAERGSPVLEELFRAVVQQAEQQRPQEEES